jgi:ferredoxin-NADP reductase
MAMLRHRERMRSKTPARLLYSSRTLADIIYRVELDRLANASDGLEVYHTLTREKPDGWKGFTRRVDQSMMQEVAWPKGQMPAVYICGPTTFVEAAASLLVSMGYPPATIKTERFGATGGSA